MLSSFAQPRIAPRRFGACDDAEDQRFVFTVFIGIFFSLLGGMHYYLYARLIRDASLPRGVRIALTVFLVGMGVGVPLMWWLRKHVSVAASQTMLVPFRFWLGFVLVAFVFVLGADLVKLLTWTLGKASGNEALSLADPGRRRFFGRVFAGVAATGAVGTGALSVWRAVGDLTVKKLEVSLAKLPSAFDGLRVVQISDLHIGPTLGRKWLDGVVERVNALSPDVVAITGDLVDGSVATLQEETAPLAKLRAKHGVYFVTGNHEYYSGADQWCAEVARLGIRVLRNERVEIRRGDAALDIAGIDDHSAWGPGHGADLDKACAGRDGSRELILLAHQPRQVKDAVRHGVGLQLSGHTHGGQIWPWHYAVYLQQPFLKGLNREGDTQVYVSEGTGFWGPPLRLGSVSEITEITLRAAKRTA